MFTKLNLLISFLLGCNGVFSRRLFNWCCHRNMYGWRTNCFCFKRGNYFCCVLCSFIVPARLSILISVIWNMHAFCLALTYHLHLLENRYIDVTNNNFVLLYYTKQIDFMLPCVCSVVDYKRHKYLLRTSVTHSAVPCVPLFCSYHHLASSVICY